MFSFKIGLGTHVADEILQMGRSGGVRFGSLFCLGQLRAKYVRVGYGSDLGEIRVRIYFGSIMFWSGMDSVRLKSGSGLFRAAQR